VTGDVRQRGEAGGEAKRDHRGIALASAMIPRSGTEAESGFAVTGIDREIR
jgi:hypothetical protein